jgi:hypothetical protein
VLTVGRVAPLRQLDDALGPRLLEDAGEHAVVGRNEPVVTRLGNQAAAGGSHARVHDDKEDRASGKVLVAGGQLDRGRHHVVRGNVVADVDQRRVGTQPEDHALHRAGVMVRRAEVREQRDDRP